MAQGIPPLIFGAELRRTRHTLARVVVLAGAAAPFALGHEGEPLEPHDLWNAWNFEPGIVIPLVLSAWLYWRGTRKVKGKFEAAAFWAGWAALTVALVSPLHPLGEALFSAHMTQHVVLMVIAAPLLVLGSPLVAFLRALPVTWRRAAGAVGRSEACLRWWRPVSAPATATVIQGVAMWGWHLPSLYQATLTSESVHALQHTCFLFSSLLFWWALIRGRSGRSGYAVSFMYVFATAVHSGILGALLTFAPTVLYPAYAQRTAAWGLTPLEDQQLGGLIMWVPAGTIYTIAGLLLFAAWMKDAEVRALRREGRTAPAPSAIPGEA